MELLVIHLKHHDDNFSPKADAPRSPESQGATEEDQQYDEAVCDCPECLPENSAPRNNPIHRHRPESDYNYEI